MKYVTVDYEYVHQTDDAVLILHGNDKAWIPKDLIKDGHTTDFEEDYELNFKMEVAEWFAIKKELI